VADAAVVGPPARVVRRRLTRITTSAVTYLALTLFGLVFAFPLFYAVLTSLKSSAELRQVPPTLIPQVVHWENYVRFYVLEPMTLRWFANTLLVIALSVPGGVLTAILVAYGFARFEFPLRDFWFMVLLSTLMLPSEVTLIPLYILFHSMGWVNTYLPLIVPAWFGGGAFSIFFIRQFFMTLPRELDDAARIDGANSFQILWRVLVPLSGPVIMSLFIFGFFAGWNDFFGPLIYLNSRNLYTMSLGLNEYRTMPDTVNVPTENLLMVGTVFMAVPCILLFAFGQRYFVRGMIMSGLKF
jgi:multiple sugar transport system permease protein